VQIAFFYVVMLADSHAHVQMLVSVIKMASVLEDCITEKQSSVVHFCGQEDSVQTKFIKTCSLFTVGSVCRVKQCTVGLRNVANVLLMTTRLKRRCGND
jgi:hypothetical protein